MELCIMIDVAKHKLSARNVYHEWCSKTQNSYRSWAN